MPVPGVGLIAGGLPYSEGLFAAMCLLLGRYRHAATGAFVALSPAVRRDANGCAWAILLLVGVCCVGMLFLAGRGLGRSVGSSKTSYPDLLSSAAH